MTYTTTEPTSYIAFWADDHHKVRLINMPLCPDEINSDWLQGILSSYCEHLRICKLCSYKVEFQPTDDPGNTGQELISRDTAEFERWCALNADAWHILVTA